MPNLMMLASGVGLVAATAAFWVQGGQRANHRLFAGLISISVTLSLFSFVAWAGTAIAPLPLTWVLVGMLALVFSLRLYRELQEPPLAPKAVDGHVCLIRWPGMAKRHRRATATARHAPGETRALSGASGRCSAPSGRQHHLSVAGRRCILYADRSVRTSKTRKEIMSENRSTAQPTAVKVFSAAE